MRYIFFLFLKKTQHILWYSLEAPQRGASNEYSQYMVSSRNKKMSIFGHVNLGCANGF